jgi:hypothetical protein
MAGLSLSYDPPGETLRAFCKSNAVARGLIGPLHGGRELCAVHDILFRCVRSKQRRWRWVAVRQDMADLEEETIPAWHKAVAADIGDWDPKALSHKLSFQYQNHPKDIEIQFLALARTEHRARYLNAKTSGIWLDGAKELDARVFERALELAGTWPSDEPSPRLVLATSLMPPKDHWLATHSEISLFQQPGGRSPQAENMANRLPPGDNPPGHYQALARGRRPDWVRVQIDAEWDEASTKMGLAQSVVAAWAMRASGTWSGAVH